MRNIEGTLNENITCCLYQRVAYHHFADIKQVATQLWCRGLACHDVDLFGIILSSCHLPCVRSPWVFVDFGPVYPQTPPSGTSTPLSKDSASFRKTSARNFLNAVSILCLLSGSAVMLRLPLAAPAAKPVCETCTSQKKSLSEYIPA